MLLEIVCTSTTFVNGKLELCTKPLTVFKSFS